MPTEYWKLEQLRNQPSQGRRLFDKDDSLDLSMLTHDIRGVLDANPAAPVFLCLRSQLHLARPFVRR